MPNRTSVVYSMVKEAGEKILKDKFCFSCQKHKPIESGKVLQKKGSSVWRCGSCAAKLSPMGFKKGSANG
jgi:ribosomal protein L37AE/L43A